MNVDKHQPNMMPQLPNQQRIAYLRELYNKNASLESDKDFQLFEEAMFDTKALPVNERAVMLASVSKIVYAWLYTKTLIALKAIGREVPSSLKLEELKELILRSPRRILTDEGDVGNFYAALRKEVGIDDGLDKLLRFLGADEENLEGMEKIQAKAALERFWAGIEKYIQDHGEIKVSLEELLYVVLGLSSNTSTRDMKGEIEKEYGYEGLATAIRKLTPSFEPVVTFAGNRHYQQWGPNTGKLSDMLIFLEALAKTALDDRQADHETAKLVVEAMSNSQEKFDFSFSETNLGRDLISKGYKIIEKTGYFPCVSWVEKLAQEGLPHHMVLASAVCIITPENEIFTFGGYDLIEVLAPTKRVVDGQDDQGNPVEFYTASGDSEYREYAKRVVDKTKPDFQAKLIKKAKELLRL